MAKQRSVRSNMIYNSVFQILIYAIPLITTPYVSRVLGADHVGQYSYALSIVTYFTLVATLGSTTHGQRIVAYSRDNRARLSEVFWNTVFFRIITTIVAIVLYLAFIAITDGISLLGIIVVLNTLNVALDISWYYQGIEDFRQTVIRGLFVKLVGLIGIFAFVKSPSDTWLYALILLGSTLLGSLSLWIRIPKLVERPKTIKPFDDFKDIFLVFLPTIATQVYLVLDKSMIGWITRSDYENGCYDQAEKLIRVALILISSVSTVILPRVANLFSQNRVDDAREYVYKAYRVVMMVAVPLFFGVLECAPILIPVYLGTGYEMSVLLMKIFSWLLIAVSLASITGLAYLVPTKQQNIYTISVTVAAGANLVMNMIMIPRIGAYGAAIASIVAESIGTVIQIWYCVKHKQLTLKDIFLPSWKYYVSGIVMFGMLVFLKSCMSEDLVSLIILVFAGAVTYGVMLLLLRDSFFIEQSQKMVHKVLIQFYKQKT